jgi:hypothetical protein
MHAAHHPLGPSAEAMARAVAHQPASIDGPATAGIVAALYGCIPLLLTDHLHEAYEPELPWASFSLRLPQNSSAWLHEELAGQSSGQVERWQVRGRAGQHLMCTDRAAGCWQSAWAAQCCTLVMLQWPLLGAAGKQRAGGSCAPQLCPARSDQQHQQWPVAPAVASSTCRPAGAWGCLASQLGEVPTQLRQRPRLHAYTPPTHPRTRRPTCAAAPSTCSGAPQWARCGVRAVATTRSTH